MTTCSSSRATRPRPILERIADHLGQSAEGKEILRILALVVNLTGADVAVIGEAKAFLPSVLSVIRAIGGIIRVESVLSEAERLTLTMRSQLDEDGASLELASVAASLDYAVDRLRAALTDASVLVEAERATTEALLRIDLSLDSVARRFAFAESTLLYADLEGTLSEVQKGLAEAHGVDLRAAGDSIGRLVDRVMPAFTLPLPPAPADGLDAMLRLIEAQVQEIARRIEAVDVTRIGAPVATLTEAVTRPIREIERVGTELTVGASGAIEGIASLVSDLPTGELTQAVATATAPLRDAMAQITSVVAGADAALRDVAGKATAALGDAEHAIDQLVAALQAVVKAAVAFVGTLHVDSVIGLLQEQLQALRTALEAASVQPYFAAAVDAIDTTASVLEKVPVVLLPDDIKEEFDTLVEPIRSLNVDAVADEVESWFALEDGKFPFEPALQASLVEIRSQLDNLLHEIEPHHPRLLAQAIDGELAPLRAQLTRLDIGQHLAPIDQAIGSVKQSIHGVDPRKALQPVHDALAQLADKVDEYSPSTLLAPVQQRIVDAREAVIQTLHLDAATKVLTDLQREALRLVNLIDPLRIEPELAAALEAARREVALLDRSSLGEWGGAILSSMMAGDGARRRPATWRTVLGWIAGEEGAGRLRARAEHIAAALAGSATAVAALDIEATAARITAGLRDLSGALQAFPADAPIRLRLTGAVARRGNDGGFVALSPNRARFRTELDASQAIAATLLTQELSRVDVVAAMLHSVGAPVVRLRNQVLGVLRQIGLRHPGDGLGAILGELLEVATPERCAAILVPIFTALRGRAEALLGSVLDPLRHAIDDIVRLLRLIDLGQITQGLDDVVKAGKQQILALDPTTVLAPTLASFDALRAEVEAFDPLAPIRAVVDGLRLTATRILDKLSVERLIEPASKTFDDLLTVLRQLDVDGLVQPLVDALHALADDIFRGLEQLRDALKRLQAAIPSTEGLALAGVVDVAVDVDLGF